MTSPRSVQTLHELAAAGMRRDPAAAAVIEPGRVTTCAELDLHADRLAAHLRASGVGPGDRVCLLLDRGAAFVAAVLATHRCGAAYVPLGTGWPVARLRGIITRVGARGIVATAGRAGAFADLAPVVDPSSLGPLPSAAPIPAAPEDVAYIIFTSGSTGEPKGVVIDHRGALNTVLDINERLALSPGDRILGLSATTFDLSVWDVFGVLAAGAAVVYPDPARDRDVAHWHELVEAHGVTVWNTVPALMDLFVEYAERTARSIPTLRAVMLSGDWIPVALPDRIRRVSSGASLWSLGGATEASIWSVIYPIGVVDPGWRSIPYGRAMRNQSIQVLDANRQPCPVGTVGDLYLGGIGLALGYWDDRPLTDAAFVIVPGGERMYRTGDLGRLQPSGDIEFLGRADFQLKINGYRIEPGEIETVLAQHPGVREAVVMAREDHPGDRRLVAYVVGGPDLDGDTLRAWSGDRLAPYLVPAQVVVLAALPLSANGKIDRQALPVPGAVPTKRSGTAPRDSEERHLAEHVAAIVGPGIGVEDDLFAAGATSLAAIRLIARCSAKGMPIELRDIFAEPTIAALARLCRMRSTTGNPAQRTLIPCADRALPVAMAPAQERLWLADLLSTDVIRPYHELLAIHLRGPLDVARLAAAIDAVVLAHENWRVAPLVTPNGLAWIAAAAPRLDAGSSAEDWQAAMLAWARVPYAEGGALARFRLWTCGPDHHVLGVAAHHAVTDGWTFAVLPGVLADAYQGTTIVPPSPAFLDVSAWLKRAADEPEIAGQTAWWRDRLAGDPPPALILGGGEADPDVPGATMTCPLVDSARLARAAQEFGVTPFMVAICAFAVVLRRATGCDEARIATPVSGRGDAALREVHGCLVNLVVLSVPLGDDPPFREALVRTRAAVMAAFAHLDAPFERVAAGRTVAALVVAYQDLPAPAMRCADLAMAVEALPVGNAKFPLAIEVRTAADGTVNLVATRARAHIGPAETDAFLAAVSRCLAGALADPDRSVAGLPLVAPPPAALAPRILPELTVTGVFATIVRLHGAAEAVVDGKRSLSYARLDRLANALAHRLIAAGVRPGDRVVLAASRSVEAVVGMVAVLKTGGAWVPIDPQLAAGRRLSMATDAKPTAVIGTAAGLASASGLAGVLIDLDQPDDRADPPAVAITAHDPAYVLFTSGSTGTPKGVLVAHGGLVRLCADGAFLGLRAGDTALHVAPLSFDLSIMEIFTALLNGARLVVHAEHVPTADGLAHSLATMHVDVAQLSTGLFQAVVHANLEALAPLRTLMVGGDALPASAATLVRRRFPNLRLFNAYGPTEATIVATVDLVGELPLVDPMPIGRALADVTLAVVAGHDQLQPIGFPGELIIGGPGVALGYLGRDDLTAEQFLPDPAAGPGARRYRTGDRVRWAGDGRLIFLGRSDRQVKVRGIRIEPGEVEAVLRRHPRVSDAVVEPRGEGVEGVRLVAWVVGDVDAADLLRHCQEHLLAAAIPSAFVRLKALPLTAHGKLDRRALPTPAAVQRVPAVPTRSIEHLLVTLWEKILGVHPISIRDRFADLGGHSLHAVRLAAAIQGELGLRLDLRDLLTCDTVERMATRLLQEPQQGHDSLVTVQEGSASGVAVVFLHGDFTGGGLYTRRLASLLGPERPFHVLAPHGCDGGPVPETIEAIAADYRTVLDRRLPGKPVVIIGFCLAGLAAWELARQLHSAGRPVQQVVLIDTWIPDIVLRCGLLRLDQMAMWQGKSLSERRLLLGRRYSRLQRLKEVCRMPVREACGAITRRLRYGPTVATVPFDGISDDGVITSAHLLTAAKYRPRSIPVPGNLVMSREMEIMHSTTSAAWARRGAPSLPTLPARHFELITDRISDLASLISVAIDRK